MACDLIRQNKLCNRRHLTQANSAGADLKGSGLLEVAAMSKYTGKLVICVVKYLSCGSYQSMNLPAQS